MNKSVERRSGIPDSVGRLAETLETLPGFGRRSSLMAALHLSREETNLAERLAEAILEVNAAAQECNRCHLLTDQPECGICADPRRQHTTVCVVQDTADVLAIEDLHIYRGVYHVLHGCLDPMKGRGPESIRMGSLLSRLKELSQDPMAELIIGTPTTLEGEMTSDYIRSKIREKAGMLTVSTLRRGVAHKSQLEFSDPDTIRRAMANRVDPEDEPDGEDDAPAQSA